MSSRPVVSRFSYQYLQNLRGGRLDDNNIPYLPSSARSYAARDLTNIGLHPIIPTGFGSKVPFAFSGLASNANDISGGSIIHPSQLAYPATPASQPLVGGGNVDAIIGKGATGFGGILGQVGTFMKANPIMSIIIFGVLALILFMIFRRGRGGGKPTFIF